MSKKLYIIDDDESVRISLIGIIDEMLDSIELAGFNENGHDGILECLALKPDLAIVDIRLPDVNGIEILHILKKRNPDIKVLIHSGFLDLNTAMLAYKGEADGILEKPSPIKEIIKAINMVLSGDDYYSPNVLEKLLTHETRAPFKLKDP